MASASESSSAVLELTDADYEEGPVVVDDHNLAPLIMEHGADIVVKVDAPMKQLSTLETFVSYRVRCACARWPHVPPFVRRRYNHFKLLHKRLAAAHPLFAVPPPPPLHSARQQLDRYAPAFVAVRAGALHAFLDSIAKHPILTHSEDFRLFCVTPDDEFDKVFKSESSALNLWGLSSALYGSSEPKPTSEPRRDPEWAGACDYLSALRLQLGSLCALTARLQRHGAALGGQCLALRTSGAGLGRGGCVAAGAARAGEAWRAAGAAGAGGAAARLPLLAAHAAAHADKIKQRHLTPASLGGPPAAEAALRAELAAWRPRARAEAKAVLRDVAARQVAALTQIVFAWEEALKSSAETDIGELFKTVSKSAVQNLSPSKCKHDTPSASLTENNIEELETYTDTDSLEKLVNDEEREENVISEVFHRNSEVSDVLKQNDEVWGSSDRGNSERLGESGEIKKGSDRSRRNSDEDGENGTGIGGNSDRLGEDGENSGEGGDRSRGHSDENEENGARIGENGAGRGNSDKNEENGAGRGNSDKNGENGARIGGNSDIGDSSSQNSETNSQLVKETDVIRDPLRDFSDVDISS